MTNRSGEDESTFLFYFLGLWNHCGRWLQPWNWKTLAPWKKSYDQPRWHIKKLRHHFADNGPYSLGYSFSSSQVQVLDLDHQEGWVPENWCLWTVMLEKTLESPLDCKKIKPVHPKGNPSWIFIGRTDAEVETPILWPPDRNNWLTRKDPDARKLKAGGEGDDRGWDGWMVSLTQWTGVWASSGSWWWTGKPGVLQSMGSQRVGHDWAIQQQEQNKERLIKGSSL